MTRDLGLVLLAIAWVAIAVLAAWATLAWSRRDRPVWPMRFNMFVMRHSKGEWQRRYARSRTSFSAREQFGVSLFYYLFIVAILAALGEQATLLARAYAARQERLVVWLPYAAKEESRCLQGALDAFTHIDIHAWDFGLPEGRPIVAVAGGRVIRVVDDRSRTGLNDFNESNQIFVDHGGGVFATYLHHRHATARVASGQLIAAGTTLAEVGRVGTIVPHIHFDVRGPSWHQTHPIRFRSASADPGEVLQANTYVSVTPSPGEIPSGFRDSMIAGPEFAANGITLRRGPLAFRIRSESPVVFRGRAAGHVQRVFFFLWSDGQPSEYIADAVPYESGNFELAVRVPGTSKGPRWYRITAHDASGRLADVATLPILVE